MKKYVVYRLAGDMNEENDYELAVAGRELVAVEYGKNIYDVTDRLIQAVNADTSGLEKYRAGYIASAHAPKRDVVDGYEYGMLAIMVPAYGEHNDLIQYGITVEKSAGE